MALKRGDREYNADKNEWEVKKPKKAAPKPKAAPAKAKAKPAAKKAPIPKDRPKKAPVNVRLPDSGKKNGRSRVDTGQAKNTPHTKLKGKVSELPSKQKKGHGIAMGKYRLK